MEYEILSYANDLPWFSNFADNSLSGTVPTQFALLTTLEVLYVMLCSFLAHLTRIGR
jgi:hypothetical protein